MLNQLVLGNYNLFQVLLFSFIIIIALFVDLFAHRRDHPISMKNAALWSVFWVALALGFSYYIYVTHGKADAYSYLSGYLLEKSLSIDNLFVFMAIFASFGIKDGDQHRVLYYGIIFALLTRMLFIAAGTSILAYFEKWAMILFGCFILYSAWKMWSSMHKNHETVTDYSNHWSVKLVSKFLPVLNTMDGQKFITKVDGKNFITPLFLCLFTIELADIMFAFDSVPAIIAITQDPFLVYTSNIFAILGLRSMYFLLAAAKRYLVHLEKSVILILTFIGTKMLLDAFQLVHIKPIINLIVVISLLFGGVVASLVFPEKNKG